MTEGISKEPAKSSHNKMKVIETDGNYSVVKCAGFKNQTT